ncbi:transposase [Enterococcus faecium]|nr:transposase [Enterococcus faecium]MBL4990350.1 transposase [Enterococcus lactis]MBK4764530.1 transposase [Enterococcus faecium]MBK4788824.1 transposase [Enterococcus faecium]MBK4791577.1 transposase [Enterococcus faecium]
MKKEEVYTTTYSDFEEAKRALFSYISSISYLTPQEFGDLSREEIA